MDVETLARWQFAITTVYHFFFVPVTIGLAGIVAGLQTVWHRRGDERYLRLTKFFGKLLLINFALGVVTGIVQEFQFGMNWSEFSRFVGDVFGAPLALEGLLAFFLESTFLGLWIFGWDRLPRSIHLATIWAAAIGSVLSAYFILAANSFMQNPVGFTYNAAAGRAELTDIGAVLSNPVVVITFPHQIFGCFMVGGAFVAGVAVWHLLRRAPEGTDEADDAQQRSAFGSAARIGAVVLIIAGIGTAITGDLQGKVMTQVQPMKMAAAEALYETEQPASFSILTIGTLDGSEEVFSIKVPYVLSFLSTGTLDGEVQGIRELQAAYEATYGPGTWSPNVPLAYWTFRAMITTGMSGAALGVLLLWCLRGGRSVPRWAWLWRPAVIALPLLPLVANTFGWVFTETGRQPWLVYGLLPTAAGVSPGTTVAEVITSMTTFTLLYGALAVVEVKLMLGAIRGGLPAIDPPRSDDSEDEDAPLVFAY